MKPRNSIARFMDHMSRLSYQSLFRLWLANIFIFGILATGMSYIPGNGPEKIAGTLGDRFLDGLYYSVIIATNTGIGDILPFGASRLFAAIESVTGLFLFAVLITKLMSRRQDVALREVHKLTFDSTFHNIREDLHTIRKDFDRIERCIDDGKEMPHDGWQDLAVGYEQIANLMTEIPHFYSTESRLYVIDEHREELLLEAIHRTFSRLNHLLETLSKKKIAWTQNEESIVSLREMITMTKENIPHWRERSPHTHTAKFEGLQHIIESIEHRLQKSLPL